MGDIQLEILVETIFHRSQHRTEIRQVTQVPPEDLIRVLRTFISSTELLENRLIAAGHLLGCKTV